jgi:hypothetical protein
VKKLFDILQNKVDWELNIYVPDYGHLPYNLFRQFSDITNTYITFIRINTVSYSGFECFRNISYKKGLSIPTLHSVAILGIIVGLNSGYSSVNIYGVDHNFFDTLCVNENNQLCFKDTHFYDETNPVIKPLVRTDNSEVYKISDYLFDRWVLFRSHDLLADYAKYLNVTIVNCTENSMIDSYTRKRK